MGMTNQEAIKELEYVKKQTGYADIALDMAIKALEQQPSEDCISRADILDAIETWDKFGINAEQKLIRWQDHYVPYVHLDDVRHAIANMPSVTPKGVTITDFADRCRECGKQKAGKWIDNSKEDGYYANCSHCGYQIDTHYERGYLNYCPNCGADMRGDSE